MPVSPYGKTNGVGGFNSGDVDWDAFYNNMGAGENNTLGGTPYTNTAWGASRATPAYVPGTANGSILVGKNQSQFGADNPLQTQQLAYTGQQPANPAGGGTPYTNTGWGAGTLPPWMPQGANPGMGGLPGYGNTQLASGIPPQGPPPPGIAPTVWAGDTAQQQPSAGGYSLAKRPGLPMSGQVGFQHNGSSNEPAAYSSGGYLYDRNGRQIRRDPNFANRPAGSRGTAAGNDGAREVTTAIQRANYDRQGISY